MSFLQVINPFGLLFAALLLLPHILFRGLRTVTKENVPNLGMYWLDRLGRFGSLSKGADAAVLADHDRRVGAGVLAAVGIIL